jgi:hypothetical protein
MRLIPTEIHENGELTKIEYHNEAGEFVIEAVWDPEDEQTSENRVKFREWATRLLDQKGYEVFK